MPAVNITTNVDGHTVQVRANTMGAAGEITPRVTIVGDIIRVNFIQGNLLTTGTDANLHNPTSTTLRVVRKPEDLAKVAKGEARKSRAAAAFGKKQSRWK